MGSTLESAGRECIAKREVTASVKNYKIEKHKYQERKREKECDQKERQPR